ncbi:hypothetical protein KO481_22450 [Nocardia sp. NEAU-G5]|uniref:MarR family transcriptional regulator n=1 Tax=Nocardia albiluteola TaxID=2842303 RepID=A0ABS6B1U3_9NOCA|nr:hypothetical protein [Nocardia albiluteola]MBU3064280.1 hypothetical protein [Nocardia albiluteola]
MLTVAANARQLLREAVRQRHLERALTQWPEQDLETLATLLGRFLEDTSHTALVED